MANNTPGESGITVEHGEKLATLINHSLTRRHIKDFYMPLLYGKTEYTVGLDLQQKFVAPDFLDKIESKIIMSLPHEFFKPYYSGMDSMRNLIKEISCIASQVNSSVIYETPLFRISQDYFKYENVPLTVYDPNKKNRKIRKVTMSLPTDVRNHIKTRNSSLANFVHQQDAYIAMKMIHGCDTEDFQIPLSISIYCSRQLYINTYGKRAHPSVIQKCMERSS